MADEVTFTLKQRRFIEEYVGHSRGNATEAARIAGYADPEQSGWQNKNKVDIWTEIEKRLRERSLASSEVLERLTQHANSTMLPFLSIGLETVSIDLSNDEAQKHIHLIKKVKCKKRTGGKQDDRWEETETEIELHDPQTALVHLGRHHKLFTDRTEGSIAVSGIIGYDVIPPEGAGPGDDHTGTQDRLPAASGAVEGVEQ